MADALARGVVNPSSDVRGDGNLGVGIALVEDSGDFLEGRVHARVDVRVFQGVVALVSGRTARPPVRSWIQRAQAARFAPVPDSLPRLQLMIEGWFLSRSKARTVRSR